ncbi:uncharacterized protein (DUF1501 family) [Actimicrobium sp. GrIS 1.19]|uniref:DUF1501 domain-containing protein n=1 Tax=Actimicrobium sp. GrIS 1.19 TaxID=3071708 RepID=UPI002E01AA27|nr:uncharacterized protein (DUF1501 family) [Actimicrobium sp. GrIS 1.19]
MNTIDPVRRRLLRAMPAAGLGTLLGANLLADFLRDANAAGNGSYKALVCIRLGGGNDAFNTVLATDPDSWSRYQTARNTGDDPIALLGPGAAAVAADAISPLNGRVVARSTPEFFGGVLPIVPKTRQTVPGSSSSAARTFALHPLLGSLQSLFQAGRLAVVANVGTLVAPVTKSQVLANTAALPRNLYSHNDQSAMWEAGQNPGFPYGWGGQMADFSLAGNGAHSIFTSVSLAGAATFLNGRTANQYQVDRDIGAATIALDGDLAGFATAIQGVAGAANSSNFLATTYGGIVQRSIGAASTLGDALASGAAATIAAPPPMTQPVTGATMSNPLATQLRMVARMIAAAGALGLRRQVFIVNLGGFDQHSLQNSAHPPLLAQVDHGLAYFDRTLASVGGVDMRANVTAFTVSDFGRTFASNGDGCDHGWGGHHFVLGGSVKGGDLYGAFPTLGVDAGSFINPDAVNNGVLIPTVAVDQYAATLAAWFGLDSAALATIFPNLGRFARSNLGFL